MTILVGAALLLADPAEIFDYTDEHTTDLLSYVLGPSLEDDRVHDATVVLVDDHYINNHSSWPMAYHEHARILSRILAFRPKAVFIDMLFPEDKSAQGIFPLLLTLRQYKAKKIEVFVAATESSRAGIHPQLAGLVTLVSTRADPDAVLHQRYDLYRQSTHAIRSPALALVSEYCGGSLENRDQKVCDNLTELLEGEEGSDPLLLRWGTTPSEANEIAFECNLLVGTTVWQQFVNVIWTGRDNALQDCPRAPTVLIENLLGGFDEPDLENYLTDQLVLYGPEIEGVTSWVSPATHLPLSSVYTHAVAVENLLLFGDRYYRADRTLFGLSVTDLIGYTSFSLVALWYSLLSFKGAAFVRAHKDRIAYRIQVDLLAWTTFIVMLVTITLLQVLYLHIAPINALGIFGLITFVREMRDYYYFEQAERFIFRLIFRY